MSEGDSWLPIGAYRNGIRVEASLVCDQPTTKGPVIDRALKVRWAVSYSCVQLIFGAALPPARDILRKRGDVTRPGSSDTYIEMGLGVCSLLRESDEQSQGSGLGSGR